MQSTDCMPLVLSTYANLLVRDLQSFRVSDNQPNDIQKKVATVKNNNKNFIDYEIFFKNSTPKAVDFENISVYLQVKMQNSYQEICRMRLKYQLKSDKPINTMSSRSRRDCNSSRSRNRNRGESGNSNKGLMWGIIALVVICVGGGIWWWLSRSTPDPIEGKNVPAFAKSQLNSDLRNAMPEEMDAYIDFSDGMQWAFDNNSATKDNIEAIVHRLVRTSNFYSLKGTINSLGLTNATDIYNKIVDPSSYTTNTNLPAPIEQTLQRIVENGKPAFLMTDFEEYKDGKIQHVAYAKKYFIDWINSGNDITFYVMDYMEGNAEPIKKHLYFTVFDGGEHRLVRAVDEALEGRSNQPRKFTLSNNNFVMARNYDKNTKGGNYHNADGKDVVTVVDETGGDNSYKLIDGFMAEYYPLNGGTWGEILENAKALSPEALEGAEGVVPFQHLIGDRVANLSLNDGFDVEQLELKVTDVTGLYRKMFEQDYDGPTEAVEIRDFLVLDQPVVTDSQSQSIAVNFDPKFDGSFPANVDSNGLFRVDVLVGQTVPKLDELNENFKWQGNNSLLESVRNTLQSTNPRGTRLMTYYIHLMK